MTIRITFAPDVLDAFPEARTALVMARGLRNDVESLDAETRLTALEQRVAAGAFVPADENGPLVGSWHEAYRAFGTNPRRIRPSIDALGRRLARNGRLPRINGAVDSYNAVSVEFGLPAGAFDADRLDGTVTIRRGAPTDVFTPLGEPETVEVPGEREVVYALGNRVLTRHWNHRDSDLTAVTKDSTNVLFILERVSAAAVADGVLDEATRSLIDLIGSQATSVGSAFIDARTPSVDL